MLCVHTIRMKIHKKTGHNSSNLRFLQKLTYVPTGDCQRKGRKAMVPDRDASMNS